LNALLVEHGGDARARLAKARLALMRDDYQSCVQQLQDLVTYLHARRAYQGRQQPILLLLAEALRRQGDVDQAERIRQQAMAQADPSWDDPYQKQVSDRKVGLKTYLVKADLTYGQGKYDESIAVLEQAIEKYPDSIWAKILLARALIRTGAPDSKRPDGSIRLRRAETVLSEVLQAEPNSVEAIFRLAVAKLYQNKPEESAALYERATALKPDFTMAHFNLAHCRIRLNDRAGAIAAAEASVAAEPSFVQGHALAGTLLMDEGRYAEAEKHFDAAVRLQPNNPQLRQQLGEARQRMQP
jgi:tetratricopeptide (TPR) repeat protein